VETEETYPQPLLIQITQDKCSLLDLFKVGQEVEVSVNLKGREWLSPISGETKYFNTIEAWRITSMLVANVPVQNSVSIQNDIPAGNETLPNTYLTF
jgi:hypothetical protein